MSDSPRKRSVLVCQHTSCIRQGSAKVLQAFQSADLPPDVIVIRSDCQGQCTSSPTVRVLPEGIWYCRVKEDDVSTIVQQHLKEKQPVREKLNPRIHGDY
ncbi:MAG: Ferredoxin, 2Fe-2S [Chroococcopsis gigantea SAG 12.99]|jgi:(2Fe-2S) ferredoxin|nr:Ferredoxin, 2Fe-2S [Chroococcopsis gigantea SAG 12.99]